MRPASAPTLKADFELVEKYASHEDLARQDDKVMQHNQVFLSEFSAWLAGNGQAESDIGATTNGCTKRCPEFTSHHLVRSALNQWSRLKVDHYPDPVIRQDPTSDERNQSSTMLRLRQLRLDDEAAFRSAYQVMAAEGFTFGFDYESTIEWSAYLKSLDDHRRAVNLPAGRIPGTFLVADAAGMTGWRFRVDYLCMTAKS